MTLTSFTKYFRIQLIRTLNNSLTHHDIFCRNDNHGFQLSLHCKTKTKRHAKNIGANRTDQVCRIEKNR